MNKIYPSTIEHFPTVSEAVTTVPITQNMLYVPNYRTDMGSNNLAVRGPKLWNSLLLHIKLTNYINTFKTSIKNLLLSQSYS